MKIKVKVVFRRNKAVVLERVVDSVPERVSVEEKHLSKLGEDVYIEEDEFEMGIPYGLPFDILPQICINPTQISENLHKAGIWTAKDIKNNPKAVQSAILSSCRSFLSELSALTSRFGSEEE